LRYAVERCLTTYSSEKYPIAFSPNRCPDKDPMRHIAIVSYRELPGKKPFAIDLGSAARHEEWQ
jgi:hypothetical protein